MAAGRLRRLLVVAAQLAVLAGQQRQQADAGPATAAVGDAVGSEDWAQQQAAAGRCHIILTSSYGYRQFIPLDAALAPAGDDPLGDVLLPTAAATPATPAALPRRSEPAATAGPTARPGDRIVLRFQVMAESDAHILLSAQRRSDRDAYEVVLGAGNNSYTDFRRLPASIPPRRAFNYSASVVSGGELRAFWLLADLATGRLAVGPDGGPPILAWLDPDPIRVRYFSLCTWTDVQGTWLYGCGSNGGFAAARDAEWMSPLDRVRQHVLLPHKRAAPHHDVTTAAHLDVERLAMDDRLPSLTVFGTLLLEWQDERLTWSPADFSGLNASYVPPADVWAPRLRTDSALAPVNGPYGSALFASTPRVQLDAAGLVRSRSPVSLQARCSLAAVWGGESYDCTLFLEALPPARPSSLTWNGSMASLEGSWEWLVAETHTLAAGALTASGAGGTPLVGMSFAVRRRGSRLSAVFAASLGVPSRTEAAIVALAFIAALVCWTASLCLSEPLGPLGPPGLSPDQPHSLRPRRLLGAVGVPMVAVAMLSMQAALPLAVRRAAPAGVSCLAAALMVSALCLVTSSLTPSWACCRRDSKSAKPPSLPWPLCKALRSRALCSLLMCGSTRPERLRWRDYPNGNGADSAQEVLDMLEALDAEEARRDWRILTVALEKAGAACCLGLGLIAVFPSLKASWV